jgi:hypothetical protein
MVGPEWYIHRFGVLTKTYEVEGPPRTIDVRACGWIAISAACFRLRFRSIIYH